MGDWRAHLAADPVPPLLAEEDEALRTFVRRDLLDEQVGPPDRLWELPAALKIVQKQGENGAWRYPGKNRDLYPETNYDLLETFKKLGELVQVYGFERRHPAVARAAEYVFSCQTEEGDIRGILGSQYMPYYHAVLTELLIEVGYGDDPRLERGMAWLLSVRQEDGGWLIPMQAVPAKEKTREVWSAPPVPPDRSLSFSHLATGMVLRALAVHPRYRSSEAARVGGELLKSRFLRPDRYNDRKASHYWTKFQYPFWWTNLLTGLDSLSRLGFAADDEDVQKGLRWFVDNQQADGRWRTSYEQTKRQERTAKERWTGNWVSLAVCRVLRRFFDA